MATTQEFPSGFKTVDHMKLKMGANVKALKGTIAVIARDGSNKGYVVPGFADDNVLCVGRFGETIDNTGGAAGAKSVDVLFHRKFECMKFLNDTGTPVVQADVGGPCFVLDNNTMTGAAAAHSVGGIVWGVSEGLVLVEPRPELSVVADLVAAAIAAI